MKRENLQNKSGIIKEKEEIKGYFIEKEDLHQFYLLVEYLYNSNLLSKEGNIFLLNFLKEWKDVM